MQLCRHTYLNGVEVIEHVCQDLQSGDMNVTQTRIAKHIQKLINGPHFS